MMFPPFKNKLFQIFLFIIVQHILTFLFFKENISEEKISQGSFLLYKFLTSRLKKFTMEASGGNIERKSSF